VKLSQSLHGQVSLDLHKVQRGPFTYPVRNGILIRRFSFGIVDTVKKPLTNRRVGAIFRQLSDCWRRSDPWLRLELSDICSQHHCTACQHRLPRTTTLTEQKLGEKRGIHFLSAPRTEGLTTTEAGGGMRIGEREASLMMLVRAVT
jgi:hypothetical protein